MTKIKVRKALMKSLQQQQQQAAGAGSMTQSKGSTRYVCVQGGRPATGFQSVPPFSSKYLS